MASIRNISLKHEECLKIDHVQIMQGELGIDVTQLVESLIIHEDIETGFVTAILSFLDDFSNPDTYYKAIETVDISFTSYKNDMSEVDVPYVKTFRVSSYRTTKDPINNQYDIVVIDLISQQSVINESIKLTRTYNNVSASQFINECCDILDVKIPRHIEETLHAKNFVAPGVCPFDMIDWMKLTSQSKEHGGADFYFFENRDGIHFKSLETLKLVEPDEVTHGLILNPRNNITTYNNILDFEKPKGFDIRDDIRYGGGGASLHTHDMITKEYKFFKYDAANITKLNPVSPRGETYEHNDDSYSQFWPHNNAYGYLDANSNTHVALLRSMSKTLINFKTMNVTIPGNVEIKAGDIINITVSARNGNLRKDESGKWLVKKLVHSLTPVSFITQLEIVTDGNIE